MPLYEYQCDACGNRFERIQKFSDPPADACPACGGTVRKLMSSPAIQFKGSGWYITDYAKKGATDSNKSSSSPGSGASGESGDKAAAATSGGGSSGASSAGGSSSGGSSSGGSSSGGSSSGGSSGSGS